MTTCCSPTSTIQFQHLTAVQPMPGSALPNSEIFRQLAKAMGFNDEALYETDHSVIDHILANSDAAHRFPRSERGRYKKDL